MFLRHNNGTYSSRKCDFAIQLVALVEAGEYTGYLADVQRSIESKAVKGVVYNHLNKACMTQALFFHY